MVAATITKTYDDFLPGFKFGYVTTQDNYTTKFGFASCEWAIVCMKNDDDVIVSVDISSGTATFGMVDDAGSSISTGTEVWFMAKGDE